VRFFSGVEVEQLNPITHVARANVPSNVGARAHPENPLYKIWHTPVTRVHMADNSRYTGAKLRKIRAEKGIGRPPEALRKRLMSLQANRPDGIGEV